MNRKTYHLLEEFMLSCMKDSAHDKEHVYRVLYNALEIAKTEESVDYDVLIGACILHDIGRKEQFENPDLCHAMVKILFDADKLDATGTIGIARTLIYKGIVLEPIYSVLPDGSVSNGENDANPSFFRNISIN